MALTTTGASASWSPDVTTLAPQDTVGPALILQASTVAGTVEGDRPVVSVLNVTDDDADFFTEGDDIDGTLPTLGETHVVTSKIGMLSRISRELWSQDNVPSMLSESFKRALIRKADAAFLAQAAPTPPDLGPATGLLNVADIHADADPITISLDPLADLIAAIEGDGGTPGIIVCAPDVWAELRKLKTGTGSNQSLIGAGTEDADRRLFSLPVITSAAITAGAGLIIDPTAVVSAVGDVQVATSQDLYFSHDSIALRATWRTGHAVVKPKRIAKFTISV